jgi:group I intron endonuclease
MRIYTIYKATNTVNNKSYIGFDSAWPRRIAHHKSTAKLGTATAYPFYNAIRKYGWDLFIWEPIYQSTDREHCLGIMENYFINENRTYIGYDDCNGYNLTLGGEGTFGHKKSQAMRQAQHERMIGQKQTIEHIQARTKARMSNPNNVPPMLHKKHSIESINLMRKAQIGIPKSESHKQAMKFRPQDTMILVCPHCGKIGDYKNMKRWHMNNCKHNKDKIITEVTLVRCEVCGYLAKQTPNFYKNHNARCNVGQN